MNATEARQTGAVLLCGLSVIGATFWTSLPPWLTILGGAGAMLLWNLVSGSITDWKPGFWRTMAITGAALTSLSLMALTTQLSALAYPTAIHPRLLSLILLAISVWAGSRGGKVILRTGAILFWFVIIMYIAIGAFSLEQIRPRPVDAMKIPSLWPLLLALLPLSAYWAEQSARPARSWQPGWLAVLILPGILCVLTLGPVRSGQELFSLYTLSKSVSIFSVVERFEILVSAAVTVGAFCLMGYLAHIVLHRCPKGTGIVLFLLTAAAAMVDQALLGAITAGMIAIFWLMVPLLKKV